MAQTAIEWLIEEYKINPYDCMISTGLFAKALEMEKEQILDAYNEAYYGDKYKWKGSEEYFNQTFNK